MKISKKKYLDKRKIKIKKIIGTSMIDWEGMIISTLYVGGCNFRCPFCYNTDLVIDSYSLPDIPEENILSFLVERKPFLDGICLSGGEPTLYADITEFLDTMKRHKLKIKLDTNGSQTAMLEKIIEQGLVDYIAMDIKNCLRTEDYARTIGVQDKQIITKIKNSIKLIMTSGVDYEFRTTIVPEFHDTEMIENIAKEIMGAQKYILQNFIQSEEMLDPRLKNIKPYSEEKMKDILKRAEPHVQECRIR
ncbi:MAG: anaerobic ribonucleoside-triphosphate reductase activating protein [Atribacterota bacterium]